MHTQGEPQKKTSASQKHTPGHSPVHRKWITSVNRKRTPLSSTRTSIKTLESTPSSRPHVSKHKKKHQTSTTVAGPETRHHVLTTPHRNDNFSGPTSSPAYSYNHVLRLFILLTFIYKHIYRLLKFNTLHNSS